MVVRLTAVLAALALSACAGKPPRPPPLEVYSIGLQRTELRDYRAGGDICSAEPRWLGDELRSPSALVGRFLDAAQADLDQPWTDESLKLVREGTETVGTIVEILAANLALLRPCAIARDPVLAAVVREGTERCRAARAVLPEVPRIVQYVEARRTRELWKRERAERYAEAGARGCNASTRQSGIRIYDAVIDCDGNREWSFCDGALVRIDASGERSWRAPIAVESKEPVRRRGRRPRPPPPPTEKPYVTAAERHDGGVERCPRLPERPAL